MAEKRRLVYLFFLLFHYYCYDLSNVRQAKLKAKENGGGGMDGIEMESGLDDIVTAIHKNNLLRIRRDNQRAGVPPPPELQGKYYHYYYYSLRLLYSLSTAVLQLRKNLKRSSFYSKQGLGYEIII